MKPDGSPGNFYYGRTTDLTSVKFKRDIASEFMHSLRQPTDGLLQVVLAL
jgi:hypothetical protein